MMDETRDAVSQKPALTGLSHGFAALKYSLHGFAVCFKEESAFRQECAFAIPHFALIFFVRMDMWMMVVLTVLWFLLVAFELLNSAIEATVDLISPEHNDLARKAKDCGSAAVLVLIIALVACWTMVVFNCVWSATE